MPNSSKAPQSYWNKLWTGERTLPDIFEHRRLRISTAYRRGLHQFFLAMFARMGNVGTQLIEVGCARSQFLPYFSLEHGFSVTGLDYSTPGCDASRQMLEGAGVAGTVHCADMFEPPDALLGSSDVVVSFGVIEHFTNTAEAVAAKTRLAKPGGFVLTTVPNMAGIPGFLQRVFDRDVYELHLPLTCDDLRLAHLSCGLDVVDSGYILPIHLGVCNLGRYSASFGWKKPLFYMLLCMSTLVQWIGRVIYLPKSEALSPYVYVLARKPLI